MIYKILYGTNLPQMLILVNEEQERFENNYFNLIIIVRLVMYIITILSSYMMTTIQLK